MRLGLSLLLMMAALPAWAQQFNLDLDVPAAHYSEWEAKGIKPAGSISAKATVMDLRPDGKWAPVFQFMLKQDKSYASLRVSFSGTATSARPVLSIKHGDQPAIETPIAIDIAKGTPVDMVLRWRADRTIEAAAGGVAAKPVVLPFTPTSLRVVASTIEVKFDDLQFR
ncbi:MAG: hypothetical protein JOY81_15160 [Alphaproteobacteria bacterium]|nr:hypothetical protein [Alphaproteobacteria bacterium]